MKPPARPLVDENEEDQGVAADAAAQPSPSGTEPVPVSGKAGIANAWRAQPCNLTADEWAGVRSEAGPIVCFDKGEIVTEVVAVVFGDGQAQRHERAAFIVSACNSHYDLVEALEMCLALGERALKKGMNLSGQSPFEVGLAVLKKARGQ